MSAQTRTGITLRKLAESWAEIIEAETKGHLRAEVVALYGAIRSNRVAVELWHVHVTSADTNEFVAHFDDARDIESFLAGWANGALVGLEDEDERGFALEAFGLLRSLSSVSKQGVVGHPENTSAAMEQLADAMLDFLVRLDAWQES